MFASSIDDLASTVFHIIVRILLRPLGTSRRAEVMTALFFEWEPAVTRFVKRLKGEIFVDIGANRGYYCFIAAKNFRVVFAVEPVPSNIVQLKQGAERAGFKNILFVEAAVADRQGDALLSHGALMGSANWTIEEEYVYTPDERQRLHIPTDYTINVPICTLQEILPPEVIDVVKVDVEGAEWRVLKGAESIMPRIRTWIIELHDIARKQELEQYMSDHGYDSKWLDEQHGLFSRRARS